MNFVFRIQECLNGFEYLIYIGNVFLFTIMILFLLSFLGILLDWPDILQEKGIVPKIKTCVEKMQKNSITNLTN